MQRLHQGSANPNKCAAISAVRRADWRLAVRPMVTTERSDLLAAGGKQSSHIHCLSQMDDSCLPLTSSRYWPAARPPGAGQGTIKGILGSAFRGRGLPTWWASRPASERTICTRPLRAAGAAAAAPIRQGARGFRLLGRHRSSLCVGASWQLRNASERELVSELQSKALYSSPGCPSSCLRTEEGRTTHSPASCRTRSRQARRSAPQALRWDAHLASGPPRPHR